MSDLRTRIAAVLYRQHYRYGNPNDITWDELEADLQDRYLEDADAVIRELKLEALELLARSWYRNYDIIPANDPRCPTDMDVAYDDAGEQILIALGLL